MEKHIIIIGSGIAGLTLAIKLSQSQPELKITLITKSKLEECNTRYAQGGIAAVINKQKDSFEEHIKDTLICGKGLCDREVVEMVIRQAPERIQELIEWGTRFDTDKNNKYELALEGGHAHARVLHHKDMTGLEIETVLISQIKKHKNVHILENHSALDLIVEQREETKTCIAIKVCDWKSKKIKTISASKVILASGGCGQVYMNTTNPNVATGDGYAIAARAGAVLRDMRFMQFHPTALYSESKENVSFLISEAVRGFGAHLIDKHGKRFLFTYHLQGELATRDVVSAAIMDHLIKTKEKYVYLDLRHLDSLDFEKHFPSILNELKLNGFNPLFDLIPVTPSAHYQCGGIKVNAFGETSIKNLFAIGETSSTGLHGANRLASNSLLEALVYAHNASEVILRATEQRKEFKSVISEELGFNDLINEPDLTQLVRELKMKMTSSAFNNQKQSIEKKREAILKLEIKAEELIQTNTYTKELLNFRNLACTARHILEDKWNAIQNTTKSKTV